MKYTVQQLARLSGVTPRTLRHYDQIGLLRPKRADNGYRYYGEEEVAVLQQILFYRACGVGLSEIADIIAGDGFDATQAMERHIEVLRSRQLELARLIATAEQTLMALKGESTMTDTEKFNAFKRNMITDNERQYGAETRSMWGDGAVDASHAKLMRMTKERYQQCQALEQRVLEKLAEAIASEDPCGDLARQTVALHRDWLRCFWPQYSATAHRVVAEMYTQDKRFAAYYDKVAPGAAVFLRDAILSELQGKK